MAKLHENITVSVKDTEVFRHMLGLNRAMATLLEHACRRIDALPAPIRDEQNDGDFVETTREVLAKYSKLADRLKE